MLEMLFPSLRVDQNVFVFIRIRIHLCKFTVQFTKDLVHGVIPGASGNGH